MRLLVFILLFSQTFTSIAQMAHIVEPIEGERKIKIKFADNCGFKINGKTNVNSFECECTDKATFRDQTFYGTVQTGKIAFDEAILNIPVSSISCGNKLMDSDLYELLDSEEHPHIKVHFLTADWDVHALWNNKLAKDDIIGHFNVVLSIAGVSRHEKVNIHRSSVDPENSILATSGEVNMNLRDFEIEPPVKFMGMVKVEENINLELDLVFHWSEVPSTDG